MNHINTLISKYLLVFLFNFYLLKANTILITILKFKTNKINSKKWTKTKKKIIIE